MSILREMVKYAESYVLMVVLISLFAASSVRGMMITLCGAALSVSMFASIAQLLLDGTAGAVAQKVSAWCMRSTAIVTAIVVISGFGVGNIAKMFAGV